MTFIWKIAARTTMAEMYILHKGENYNALLAQYEKIIELDNEGYLGRGPQRCILP